MAMDQEAAKYSSNLTNIPLIQVVAVLSLLYQEDCTIPFITRYRKEKTGGLDEVQIQNIQEGYDSFIEREKRRTFIIEAITKMEKMTDALKTTILKAQTINQLEDIYAPFKSKRKTKGAIAKEAGLEELSNIILTTKGNREDLERKYTEQFLNPEKKITNFEEAITSACDILIELFAHGPDLKNTLREMYWKDALLVSTKRSKAQEIKDCDKYKDYFEFSQKIVELKSPKLAHRFMAMRRGMTKKILKVEVSFDEELAISQIRKHFFDNQNLGLYDLLLECAKKSHKNYIHPSLDLEVKTELKKLSDESAISVFGINLKNLLLQPYLGAKRVLAVDPGIRTGCKLAVIDETGKFLVDTIIYPHPPQNKKVESVKILEEAFNRFNITHVAIGNGTFGRETLQFITSNCPSVKEKKVTPTLISEAGASIYSASAIARKEFPDQDPTVRGAISIGRRFQDPLAELVKIDPKSIGVGQYQHDVNQVRLKKSLGGIVESCVNYVGVDLNTASAPLLSFVSGVGPQVAENIISYRDKHGAFKSRKELLSIPRFSMKTFEQAAGFLRIYNGEHPLDSTFIHPEKYPILENWVMKQKLDLSEMRNNESVNKLKNDKELINEIGEMTFEDILVSLTAPSQDPRTEFQSTSFNEHISTINDLKIDQWYTGIVTNITQFGAFVDIGIKENGLLHISQIADKFVENPLDILKVGEEVKAKVISVDFDRKRISLSCKQDSASEHSSKQEKRAPSAKQQRPNKGPEKKLKNNAFAGLKGFKI